MCIPSYLWLLVSHGLGERLEDFYCRVKQGVFILYLPIALVWQLRGQYNMVEEVECRLKAKQRHSDKLQGFVNLRFKSTMK